MGSTNWFISISVILCIHLSVTHVSANSSTDFSLNINHNGTYDIVVKNLRWLKSAPTWFTVNNCKYSTEHSHLKLKTISYDHGIDNIGSWNSTVFKYDANGTDILVTFGKYTKIPFVFFGQSYLQDTYGTSAGNVQEVTSSFPAFTIPTGSKMRQFQAKNTLSDYAEANLGYYAIRGYMAGDDAKAFGRFNIAEFNLTDGHHIGPVALFDGNGPTLIISPFINFMAASKWIDHDTSSLNFGFMGRANMIPQGTEMWTMAYYSNNGINNAFEEWGTYMQEFYNAKNNVYAASDPTSNYLGYWTDNGGYYYYIPEKGKNFEDTLLDIKEYADEMSIPYRYIQLDSWFYPKYPMQSNGGIMKWIPFEKYFPHGLQYLTNKTRLFLSTHSKWWSSKTPLAKQNGGPYDFVLEGKYALPVDYRFWLDILSIAKQWGTVMFEQDWLAQMYDWMSVLQTNVTVGRQYMLQMGEALRVNNIFYQQGTSYPRHVLVGLEIPSLTQQRVTMDYGAASYNWKIGITSLWVYSLGQQVFKDVYWTTPNQNCPKYPGKKHPFVFLESLVSSLSAGPVGPGDGIGKSNRSVIMRCCNKDGLILKPDKPATALDAQYYETAFRSGIGPKGEIWSTYSEITNMFFGIIFAADIRNSFQIHPKAAGFPSDNIYWYTDSLSPVQFTDTSPIKLTIRCSMSEFCLFYTTQLITIGKKEVFLLGEKSKWIRFSKKRIETIEPRSEDLLITMTGAIQEVVYFESIIDGHRITTECNLGVGGRAVLSVITNSCLSI